MKTHVKVYDGKEIIFEHKLKKSYRKSLKKGLKNFLDTCNPDIITEDIVPFEFLQRYQDIAKVKYFEYKYVPMMRIADFIIKRLEKDKSVLEIKKEHIIKINNVLEIYCGFSFGKWKEFWL